jgi:hypothetical protein
MISLPSSPIIGLTASIKHSLWKQCPHGNLYPDDPLSFLLHPA